MTPTHQNSPSFSTVSPRRLRSELLTFFHSSELERKKKDLLNKIKYSYLEKQLKVKFSHGPSL